MEIESIKSRIKENREKTFILEKKSKIFEEDIIQAQERLTLAKNLTPVEMLDVGNDTDEITVRFFIVANVIKSLKFFREHYNVV